MLLHDQCFSCAAALLALPAFLRLIVGFGQDKVTRRVGKAIKDQQVGDKKTRPANQIQNNDDNMVALLTQTHVGWKT